MKTPSLRRFGFGALLFIALGGPTPGAVGSCNDDVKTADPVEFCIYKKSLTCIRENARGDIQILPESVTACAGESETAARQNCEREDSKNRCLSSAQNDCAGISWGNTCSPPNEIQADACLQALGSMERIGQATSEIGECNSDVLCPPIEGASGALTEEVTP